MLHNLTGWHALVILAIIILVFGAAKLPALAKSLGQSVRILKDETTDKRSDDSAPAPHHHEAATDPIVTDPNSTTASARVDYTSVNSTADDTRPRS
ncbi:twin-arginine translocase TatA/TatE family subunit [Brevibacterium spongiae]|uniref:Sec-independent protein translocase protein TatA n=1 Tax=Brevibacterium spongiae TaxID=2909672 RepID=A0ABY5SWT2_9MICO|nr:twin-arginine translocase TatA/TatE family subunit [Brevibacterium spongiae]UVI37159.1 twin-arginine translocase TatA/TatE family subunit [Brevibacterium spongiae]